ncbi:hypothetical protein AQUCO_00300277v1 [Aquilegia coerulea]|uniref:Uncharacterized protein n=1 Tax=Aquilegia coerulea TaxID=218851 RepID=A0A2G5EY55_AQUCA|nr:hypothetical protein AQUCO_00300277v1 [Aquilegia coerulea]
MLHYSLILNLFYMWQVLIQTIVFVLLHGSLRYWARIYTLLDVGYLNAGHRIFYITDESLVHKSKRRKNKIHTHTNNSSEKLNNHARVQ